MTEHKQKPTREEGVVNLATLIADPEILLFLCLHKARKTIKEKELNKWILSRYKYQE